MKEYAKWLAALTKRVPFVHKRCAETAAPGTLPEKYILALDLDTRLRQQQRRSASMTAFFVLKCVDCGDPVGDTKDRNVPTRCKSCQAKAK